MKKNDFSQSISFKLVMYDRIRTDGTSTIYLRVTIDRQKRDISLKTYWPKKNFDGIRQLVLSRHSRDAEVDSTNLILSEVKSRAHRIQIKYFSIGKTLTLDQFSKEFLTYESRDNFLHYWEQKQESRCNSGEITRDTMVRHNTNLRRFKNYLGEYVFFPIGDINHDLIVGFQTWLLKKKAKSAGEKGKGKLAYNTMVGALKNLQTYLNLAKEDGHKFDDPFSRISMRYQPGFRETLTLDEVKSLIKLLNDEDVKDTERLVLRKFLFSCFTGLRISDNNKITRGMVINDCLHVSLKKGSRFGKTITVPLPNLAKELIANQKGKLFDDVADKTSNELLKRLAIRADIHKNLTFHVSRDTFATLFIEMGGDAFTLKDILGHGDIRITQIYVKMSENRKATLMDNFNKI